MSYPRGARRGHEGPPPGGFGWLTVFLLAVLIGGFIGGWIARGLF